VLVESKNLETKVDKMANALQEDRMGGSLFEN